MSRYFTITFVESANKKINEETKVLKNLKGRDLASANVILDFKNQTVLKCRIKDNLPVAWDTVIGYYSQYYGDTFADLVRANNEEQING